MIYSRIAVNSRQQTSNDGRGRLFIYGWEAVVIIGVVIGIGISDDCL